MSPAIRINGGQNIVLRNIATRSFDVGISARDVTNLNINGHTSYDRLAIDIDNCSGTIENITAFFQEERPLSSLHSTDSIREEIRKEMEPLPFSEKETVTEIVDEVFRAKDEFSFRKSYMRFVEIGSQYAGIISCVQGLIMACFKSQ